MQRSTAGLRIKMALTAEHLLANSLFPATIQAIGAASSDAHGKFAIIAQADIASVAVDISLVDSLWRPWPHPDAHELNGNHAAPPQPAPQPAPTEVVSSDSLQPTVANSGTVDSIHSQAQATTRDAADAAIDLTEISGSEPVQIGTPPARNPRKFARTAGAVKVGAAHDKKRERGNQQDASAAPAASGPRLRPRKLSAAADRAQQQVGPAPEAVQAAVACAAGHAKRGAAAETLDVEDEALADDEGRADEGNAHEHGKLGPDARVYCEDYVKHREGEGDVGEFCNLQLPRAHDALLQATVRPVCIRTCWHRDHVGPVHMADL